MYRRVASLLRRYLPQQKIELPVGSTVAVLVDMQEGFVDMLQKEDQERIIPQQVACIRLCAEKRIPILVLEGWTYIYGRTVDCLRRELRQAADRTHVEYLDKRTDSGFSNVRFRNLLYYRFGAETILAMGINASACVRATMADARELGYEFVTAYDVIADGCVEKPSLRWLERNGTVVRSLALALEGAS